jgi:VWFA-related protein
MRIRTAVAVAFAAAVVAGQARAQMKETISVNVVEVPVTVSDGSGNAVRGLTQANFRLLDGGKERKISGFEVIDLHAAPNDATARMNPAARRNFMLLFDLSFSSPRTLVKAQEAARNFVKKGALPRDLIGVGTIDLVHGFKLLTSFTSDRELVSSAINNPAGFVSSDPLQLSNETRLATVDSSGDQIADMLAVVPHNGGMELGPPQAHQDRLREQADSAVRGMKQMEHANDAYLRGRVEKQIDLLGELAKTLRSVPGRKQILFLSEGFDAMVVTGRNVKVTENEKSDRNEIVKGDLSQIDNDNRFGNTTSQSLLNQMAQYFRGSDVVLHALDIQGVRVQNDQNGSRINSNEGLSVLAAPTGGTLFQNSNDLSADFDRLLRAQEVIYVLSFSAPVNKPGQFHPITVKLVKAPSGSQASSRSGYYEAGGETKDERTLNAAEIILNDVAQDGIKVDAMAVPFPTATTNAQVPVILEMAGGDIVRGARTTPAPIEVYLYAFDEAGTVRDRVFQRVTLDMMKVKEKLLDTGVKFYATLSLPPGKYAVKALVREAESDLRGFARTDVVVPPPDAFALLSPVFIDSGAAWVLIKGASHAAAGSEYPFHLDADEFVPSATARIRSGDTPRFAVFVQNADPEDVTVETNPPSRFLGAARATGMTAFLMQLDDMPASVAKLDITLHKKGVPEPLKASVQVEP